MDCIYCGFSGTKRNGYNAVGNAKYKCKECGRQFVGEKRQVGRPKLEKLSAIEDNVSAENMSALGNMSAENMSAGLKPLCDAASTQHSTQLNLGEKLSAQNMSANKLSAEKEKLSAENNMSAVTSMGQILSATFVQNTYPSFVSDEHHEIYDSWMRYFGAKLEEELSSLPYTDKQDILRQQYIEYQRNYLAPRSNDSPTSQGYRRGENPLHGHTMVKQGNLSFYSPPNN